MSRRRRHNKAAASLIEHVGKRRIGVYGGTFDPIHNGHLSIAGALINAFGLDQMLLVPAFVPPHKRRQMISSPFHRMAMLALATADLPQLTISTIELELPERPYTIETLGRLKAELDDIRLFFVMGADSFRDVTMWREHERILTEYDCLVAVRPEGEGEPMNNLAANDGLKNGADLPAHLAPTLQARVIDLRQNKMPSPENLASPHIYLTDYVESPISSTTIRNLVFQGHSIEGMTPPQVASYISKYCLYQVYKA